MYLRSKFAIVLAILGLVVLGLGIGQRTIWLPPATITAGVEGTIAPAPVTVIGPEVLKAKNGNFTMTIKSKGPIQLAVAQQRDITGWVGAAAHTDITGVNGDFTALATKSISGDAKVPNPTGSDMWVSEEKGTNELSYTWQAPGHGDWALLLSSDGTAPAPTDISLTTDNDAATPWAVPLMVIGSALLALAALLFFIVPRKTEPAVAGRRAAGRTPSDPATGAMEVDRIIAARDRTARANEPKTETIADARRAARRKEARAASGPVADRAAATAPPESAEGPDHATALPDTVLGADGAAATGTASVPVPVPRTGAGTGSDVKESGADPVQGGATSDEINSDKAKADKATSETKQNKDNGKDDDAGTPSSGSGTAPGAAKENPKDDATGTGEAKQGAKDDAKNTAKDAAKGKPAAGKDQFSAQAAAVVRPQPRRTVPVKARWGAALAAVLMAGTVGPAVAADSTTPAVSSSATASPSASASAAGDGMAALPVLLDSQVQKIASAVATVVTTGDNAKNATELQSRVAGMALQVRAANYKIRSKVSKQAAVDPVNSTKLLARVVTTDSKWPRSAMFVTQGDGNALPQLLTLVQASARENYKLISATPLLPGQTFPSVDKDGAARVPLDSATGLQMSPKDAIAALSDRLTKADSKWKSTFKDTVYIPSVLETQAQVLKEAKDASYVFSHTPDTKSALAMRTADGGAMVVVGYSFGIDATSKADASLTIQADAAALAGGSTTTKGFVMHYAEPVVMYIPPASAKGQIGIVSANRNLVDAKLK